MLGRLGMMTVRLACHERADQAPWHGSRQRQDQADRNVSPYG